MKDCRIKHAQICVRCDRVIEETALGLRYHLCDDCRTKLHLQLEGWKQNGLYLMEVAHVGPRN